MGGSFLYGLPWFSFNELLGFVYCAAGLDYGCLHVFCLDVVILFDIKLWVLREMEVIVSMMVFLMIVRTDYMHPLLGVVCLLIPL